MESSSISDDTIDSELPPLQFPEDDFWNVFVTVANSTLEIWLRIIGPQYSVSKHMFLFNELSFKTEFGLHVC